MAPPKKPAAAAPPPAEPPAPVAVAVASPPTSADADPDAGDEPQAPEPPAEQEIVAVGTVSHVIRRAFHHFYNDAAPHTPTRETIVHSDEVSVDATASAVTETSQSPRQEETLVTLREEPLHPYVAIGASRKQLLQDSLALTQSTASALLTFLDERYSAAAARDEAIARDLARQGLVVRAQIPMGPSNLQLDPQDLDPFGAFASTLIHTKTLVRDYHAERLDKSGNGPMFRARKVAGITREPPGYLATTSSYDVRKETTLAVHEQHIQTAKTHAIGTKEATVGASETGNSESTQPDKETVRFGKDDQMSAPERRRNMAILERMQTKLDFLRNPRYAPSSSGADDHDDVPVFVAVPSPVAFNDYDVGGVYEQTFAVRNTSHLSRRVRVLPPATVYFSIAQISFPDASGLIAPGMHVQVKLRFAPDSRADYKDALTIQYESGGSKGGSREFSLPVVAQRTPPEVSIPLLLRAQPTLVGSQSVATIPCKNTGGKARFWLMSERDWARCEATTAFRAGGAITAVLREFQAVGGLRVGPFTVSPSEMELATGESVPLQITFLPPGIGELRDKFVMVCDNCLVRVFQLVGRGCQVDVSISTINEHVIDRSLAHMGRVAQLVFAQELLLNTTATQRFTMTNDTPLDLPFTWQLERQNSSEQEPCPFRVSPSTGILPQSDAMVFSVAFSPHSAKRFSQWRLVLYINKVPACSLPGPNQLTLISETYQRLREAQHLQRLGDGLVALTAAEPAVEGMRVALHGAGRLGAFHLEPPVVRIAAESTPAGLLSLGQTYTTVTRVTNDCDAVISVRWDLARARLLSHDKQDSSLFDLEINHLPGLEVAPRSHVDVTIAFTPRAVGHFAVCVPCSIFDPYGPSSSTVERWLRIEGIVAQPELRIVSPEIDFGLVLASASADATLTIRNDSPIATGEWTLVHLEASEAHSAAIASTSKPSNSDNTSDTAGTTSSTARTSLRRSSSKDSISSRTSATSGGKSTTRSSTGSLALFTSRDLAPRASIAFTPSNGKLRPGETLEVRVTCQSGSLPERFRGTLALRPAVTSLPVTFASGGLVTGAVPALSCVSARAEIQSPNVFLTPLRISLGTTFLGVQVERELQLVNVSNLDADFKFVEPQGASKACSIECTPQQGVLHSKQTLNVRIRYTPRQAGKTTTLLACSVKGLAGPLGLELVSTHKGLVLTYDVVPLDAAHSTLPLPPKELAKSRGISVSDGDLEPDGNPHVVPKLLFGDEIPLTQRRSLRLVIRNFSGIHAELELEPKRYAAAPFPVEVTTPKTSSSTSGDRFSTITRSSLGDDGLRSGRRSPMTSKTTSQKHSKAALLSDAKDASRRFQSDAGRAHIRSQDHAQQDRALLRDGHGVAFVVSDTTESLEPLRTLRIAPWDQLTVTVTCFNNMPGAYSDVLSCRAVGLPPVLIPVHATVVGTPLVLDANCVGLHLPRKSFGTPTFSFGHVCVRSPAVTKTLRVLNRGPRPVSLAWRLVDPTRENQLVQVSLRVDFTARVQLRIAPLADDDAVGDLPFEVVPSHSHIAPFSSASVTLTFFPTADAAPARTLLVADAHWLDDSSAPLSPSSSIASSAASLQQVTSPSGTLSSSHKIPADPAADPRCETPSLPSARLATAAGKAIQAVRVANSLARSHTPGTPITPMSSVSPKCIRLLLRAAVVEPELFLDQRPRTPMAPHHIKFSTWSTLLAAPDAAWNHAFHRRELSLINHLNARLTFRLEATGPFAVTRAESLAPRHPLATADLPPAHRRADGESFMFTLPPQMAVRIELRVDPAKLSTALAEHSASNHKTEPRDTLSRRIEGELHVRFTNQSVQTLRLACTVLRPQLVASPAVHSFGRVFLSQSRSVVLRLANPTRVPATFLVRHVPRPTPLSRAQHQEMVTHHAHFVDEPSVFTFAMERGHVRGPTISLRSAGGAPQPATNSTRDLYETDDDDDDERPRCIVFAPLELSVVFRPCEIGKRYKSRFRLCVEEGVDFDVVLEGQGHLNEVEYRDQDRPMVRAKELTHQNLIFKTLTSTAAPPLARR